MVYLYLSKLVLITELIIVSSNAQGTSFVSMKATQKLQNKMSNYLVLFQSFWHELIQHTCFVHAETCCVDVYKLWETMVPLIQNSFPVCFYGHNHGLVPQSWSCASFAYLTYFFNIQISKYF